MVFAFFSNPIVLTAFVGVAIGIMVYEYFQEDNRKTRMCHHYGSSRRSHSPGRSSVSSGYRSSSPSSRSTMYVTDSSVSVRNRELGGSSASRRETVQKVTDSSVSVRSRKLEGSSPVSTAIVQKDKKSCDRIRNSDSDEEYYEENVLDKIRNDLEYQNKNFVVENKFDKNISDEDSDSTENDFHVKSLETGQLNDPNQQYRIKSSVEKKRRLRRYRQNIVRKEAKKREQKYEGIKKPSLDLSDEVEYKNNVLNRIMYDVESTNQSYGGAKRKTHNYTNQPLCKACEEEYADAICDPCEHCYLCVECARKFFRLSKVCNICQEDIVSFRFCG